jgi:hypothetical protein
MSERLVQNDNHVARRSSAQSQIQTLYLKMVNFYAMLENKIPFIWHKFAQ